MSLLDNIKKVIPEALYNQLTDALPDNFDWDYVPRKRLNDVIAKREELRAQLDALTSGEGAEGEPVKPKTPAGAKTLTQADIDAAVAAASSKHLEEMDNYKLQVAVTEKLREAKVREPKLLLPQLDLTKIKIDKGVVTGLDEQITSWKTSAPYLFGDVGSAGGTGAEGHGSSSTPTSRDTLQKAYDDALKAGNTALSIALQNQLFNYKE